MDALSANALEGVTFEIPPANSEPTNTKKRESGYKRQKTRAELALKDIAVLEVLLGTVLKILELATSPDITDQERARYRRKAADIRASLNE